MKNRQKTYLKRYIAMQENVTEIERIRQQIKQEETERDNLQRLLALIDYMFLGDDRKIIPS